MDGSGGGQRMATGPDSINTVADQTRHTIAIAGLVAGLAGLVFGGLAWWRGRTTTAATG
jgi:hypothetical protein